MNDQTRMELTGTRTRMPGRLSRAPQIIACLVPLAAIASGTLRADEPSAKSGATLELFDGKSLEGWKKTDFNRAGEVKVDDGKISMAAGRSMTGITSTRKDLLKVNYELAYEAMRTTGNDFFAAATFPVGESFITFVNGGWGGNITGLSSLNGADASENSTTAYFKYQDKTWYKFRVRVVDDTIRCWIDDKEIVAVNYKGRQVGTRIETRANQPLGFATWSSGGALRNITMRPLTAEEVAVTRKKED
jgi:hypothetical protein